MNKECRTTRTQRQEGTVNRNHHRTTERSEWAKTSKFTATPQIFLKKESGKWHKIMTLEFSGFQSPCNSLCWQNQIETRSISAHDYKKKSKSRLGVRVIQILSDWHRPHQSGCSRETGLIENTLMIMQEDLSGRLIGFKQESSGCVVQPEVPWLPSPRKRNLQHERETRCSPSPGGS